MIISRVYYLGSFIAVLRSDASSWGLYSLIVCDNPNIVATTISTVMMVAMVMRMMVVMLVLAMIMLVTMADEAVLHYMHLPFAESAHIHACKQTGREKDKVSKKGGQT